MGTETFEATVTLNKTCNHLTKADVLAIMADKPEEDKNELKALITSGKSDFRSIRAWVYNKYLKKDTAAAAPSKNEFLDALLNM